MAVTTLERDELIRRVSARVKHARVGGARVRDMVDRVIDALPEAPNVEPTTTVVVTRADMPDLASQLRRAAPQDAFVDLVAEQSGRHTVVVASVRKHQRELVRHAATQLGAMCTERGA